METFWGSRNILYLNCDGGYITGGIVRIHKMYTSKTGESYAM